MSNDTTPATAVSGELKNIDYDLIVAPDDNVRGKLTDIDELASSIENIGLLQAITVHPENGHYVVDFGFRRHAALGLLIREGRWSGPVTCIVEDVDPDARQVAMLVENLHRVDLNPVEEAMGLQRLIVEFKYTVTEAAIVIARSEQTVKDRLALCSLTKAALDAVREGRWSIEAGVAATKASPKLQEEMAKQSYTPDHIRQLVNREAGALLLKHVNADLDDKGIKVLSDYSTPKGYEWITNTDVGSVAGLQTWLKAKKVTDQDQVRTQVNYEGKISVTLYRKTKPVSKTDAAKAAAERDERIAKSRKEQLEREDKTNAQRLSPEVYAWWKQCQELQTKYSDALAGTDAALQRHRAEFTRDLKPADIAAAAIRRAAREAASAMKDLDSGYSSITREYVAIALGVDVDSLPPKKTSVDKWFEWFQTDSKLIQRAAALGLLPQASWRRDLSPTLEAQWDQASKDAGIVPDTPTFPPMPAGINDDRGDDPLTWEEIDRCVIELSRKPQSDD